jgi:glycine hydroxymethyltransferase
MEQMSHLLQLVRCHNRFVADRVDLIASNSWVSHFVRMTLASSLPNNYCIGLPGNRLYGGCSYIDMLEREVIRLARGLFAMNEVVVQFLSGMQANIGAFNAILKPGDTVVSAQARHGGHYSHGMNGPLRFYSPRIVPIPFDESNYNIDVEKLADVMAEEKPKLLLVGWSEFLFPHDLPALRKLCDEHGTRLMYDMSHVAGLVAGGVFQADLGQYADIVTSSTGKSLHAPDHGIVLFNDPALKEGVLDAVMPLLTSNTHPQEMAALGIALAEHEKFGAAYATQVVRNAQALGAALAARSRKVLYPELGFTQSHTILMQVPSPDLAVSLLDRAGILANACPLPWDEDGHPTGLRLGTQVVTRRGMVEAEMEQIADAVDQVLSGANPDEVSHHLLRPLAGRFDRTAFSFDFHFPLAADWYNEPLEGFTVERPDDLVASLIPFADCSREQIDQIVPFMTLQRYEQEQVLFEAGTPADDVCFVIDGEVEVFARDEQELRLVASLPAGTHFGELGVMQGAQRCYGVRARAGTRLLRMAGHDFLQLLEAIPALQKYFQHHVTTLRAANQEQVEQQA